LFSVAIGIPFALPSLAEAVQLRSSQKSRLTFLLHCRRSLRLYSFEVAKNPGLRSFGRLWQGAKVMQHKHLRFGHGFHIVLGNEHSQAAQMTIAPGETEGGPYNRHRSADQWLFVVSGRGVAIVQGERVDLREGTVVLIQRGEIHEIRNTGREAMKTLNIYVPPGYTSDGDELAAGRA
jgi:mannose-6-phosphate isomerase-like protein (cupin superfamily)